MHFYIFCLPRSLQICHDNVVSTPTLGCIRLQVTKKFNSKCLYLTMKEMHSSTSELWADFRVGWFSGSTLSSRPPVISIKLLSLVLPTPSGWWKIAAVVPGIIAKPKYFQRKIKDHFFPCDALFLERDIFSKSPPADFPSSLVDQSCLAHASWGNHWQEEWGSF